jgi:hypothetical protein
MTMGRLTFLVVGALVVIAAIVVAIVFITRGSSNQSTTTTPGPDSSNVSTPQPLDTTRPTPTLAPSPNPSYASAGQKYNAGQLIDAATAVSQAYLQYCAYQPKESANQHLARMRPYFAANSSFLKPSALASDVASATCNTTRNQVAGVDSKGHLVYSVVVKSKAKLKAGGTRNRTITGYVTVVQQAHVWRVTDIQQSSVASK